MKVSTHGSIELRIAPGLEVYVFIPAFQNMRAHWQKTAIHSINPDNSINIIIYFDDVIKTFVTRLEDIGILWTTWESDTDLEEHTEVWESYIQSKSTTWFSDSKIIGFEPNDCSPSDKSFNNIVGPITTVSNKSVITTENMMAERIEQLENCCHKLIDHFMNACSDMISDWENDPIVNGCIEIKQNHDLQYPIRKFQKQ